jgi:nitrile hydratase accessory protein
MDAPLAIDGPAAPPRSNGELVFAEPWESRAFGMAVTLHDAGVFAWEQFQGALIARIAADEDASYYRCWLAALEDVLAGEQTVLPDEITARVETLETRPAGHDH